LRRPGTSADDDEKSCIFSRRRAVIQHSRVPLRWQAGGCCQRTKVKVYDVVNFKEPRSFDNEHTQAPCGLSPRHPAGIGCLTSGADKHICIWDIETGKLQFKCSAIRKIFPASPGPRTASISSRAARMRQFGYGTCPGTCTIPRRHPLARSEFKVWKRWSFLGATAAVAPSEPFPNFAALAGVRWCEFDEVALRQVVTNLR